MTNIDKLKSFIQKAVPDIMKLDLGCQFSGEGYSYATILHVSENHPYFFVGSIWAQGSGVLEGLDFDKRNLTIHGRDIRLADIFWAMMSRYSTASREVIMLLDLYNFRDDNLDNQSDECK